MTFSSHKNQRKAMTEEGKGRVEGEKNPRRGEKGGRR
jgi:hypothetical protein